MSEPLLFIEKEVLENTVAYLKEKGFLGNEDYELKGIVLIPSALLGEEQVYYLNPVYQKKGAKGKEPEPDIIYAINKDATCPYPPGYPVK